MCQPFSKLTFKSSQQIFAANETSVSISFSEASDRRIAYVKKRLHGVQCSYHYPNRIQIVTLLGRRLQLVPRSHGLGFRRLGYKPLCATTGRQRSALLLDPAFAEMTACFLAVSIMIGHIARRTSVDGLRLSRILTLTIGRLGRKSSVKSAPLAGRSCP